MKAVLVDRELDEVVDGSEVKTLSNASNWERKNKQAVALLVINIGDSELVHIRGMNKAKDMWMKLEEVYKNKALSNRIHLRRRLLNSKLIDGENMVDHIKKMKVLCHQLDDIGSSVSEEDLSLILLSSLPDTYDPLIISLETLGTSTKLQSDMVVSRLLAEYSRREEGKTRGETALVSHSSINNNRPKASITKSCSHCGKTNHSKEDCWNLLGRPGNSNKKKNRSSAHTDKAQSGEANVLLACSSDKNDADNSSTVLINESSSKE